LTGRLFVCFSIGLSVLQWMILSAIFILPDSGALQKKYAMNFE